MALADLVRAVVRAVHNRGFPIQNAVDLKIFLKEQSAFVSQKTVVEYCRIKAGVRWQKLFKERAFLEALERSRWISMRAVLCDLTVIVEGYLRDSAHPYEMRLADALATTVESILTEYDHAPEWRDENRAIVDELRRRLARAQMADPLPPDRVARTAGNILFDALPVHEMLRQHDREVIVNNTRFGMVRFWETMMSRIDDRAALAASLVAMPLPRAFGDMSDTEIPADELAVPDAEKGNV